MHISNLVKTHRTSIILNPNTADSMCATQELTSLQPLPRIHRKGRGKRAELIQLVVMTKNLKEADLKETFKLEERELWGQFNFFFHDYATIDDEVDDSSYRNKVFFVSTSET